MKKLFAILLLSGLFVPSLRAQHKSATPPRLSAPTLQYLSRARKVGKDAVVPDYVYKVINNKRYISAMIKVRPDVDQSTLDNMGVFIGTRAGTIWTAQVPVEKVEDFSRLNGIECIELDLPIFPNLDSARKVSRADSVHRGINLPMAYTGKNVITGIIDAGFDFNHPTFYDSTHGHYRIGRVWCQKRTGGTPPSGYAYGSEYTDTNTIRAIGYDTAITSHGSHVAGIVAGSGIDGTTTGKYRGFSYEGDIVLVGIMPAPAQWVNTGVSDVIDGMNYIYTYAASVGKPAVVNLSWGSTLGPHDGHSLFSQAADFLTGPGKIFVCAAGNNGEDTVHLEKQFVFTDTIVHTFVNFSPYLDTAHQMTYLDVWGDTTSSFCLGVRLFNGATAIDSTGFVCMSADSTYNFNLVGSNGDTCFVTMTTVPVEFNGRPHVYMYFYSRVHDKICLTTKGYSGSRVNMWEGFLIPPTGYYGSLSSDGYGWATSGDAEKTVSDIGSTRSAITVGAFNAKVSFRNISGVVLGYTGAFRGKLAPFSSHGPTLDGRIKPDITASGFGVVSSVSSYDSGFMSTGTDYNSVIEAYTDPANSRSYEYAILAGTSMASPCVSGIVGLMLQHSPTLTPDSVKTILALTAIKDTYTSVTLPPMGTNLWGHGKVNAYKAMRYLVGNLSVDSKGMDIMDCVLFPNPNRGQFTLAYTGKTAEALDICIYDITGRMVACYNWPVTPGSNKKDLDLSHLTKGTYLTRVTSKAGYNTIKTMIQ